MGDAEWHFREADGYTKGRPGAEAVLFADMSVNVEGGGSF